MNETAARPVATRADGPPAADPWERTLQRLYASPAPVRRRPRPGPVFIWGAAALALAVLLLVLVLVL